MRRRILEVAPTVTAIGEKVIACGDLHVRETTPTMRTEKNFFEEVIEPKINFIVETSDKYEAPICIAGDIFDNAHPRYFVANRISQLLRKAKYGIFAVPGQHDMNYHSQLLMDTPYQSLIESRVIKDTHGSVRILKDHDKFKDATLISGAGFGVEPELLSDVLLVHSCITENNPPFFLEDAHSASGYLEKYPQWKLIISGDYHASHVYKSVDGRLLVNCGPMFRKEKTQIDLQPKIYVINIDDLSYEAINIPCRVGTEAFDLAKIDRVKKLGISENDINTEKLQKLIEGSDEKTALNYEEVVNLVCTQFLSERGITVPKDKIISILQRAKNG